MTWVSLILLFVSVTEAAPHAREVELTRFKRLRDFVHKERPDYERRKKEREDLLESLDRLNIEQNEIRKRMTSVAENHSELTMALNNLAIEHEKQKQQELVQKHKLNALLRVAHRIKRDGVVRFLINGDNLSDLAGRVRILFRTLRAHSQVTKQLGERTERLAESERRILEARTQERVVWEEGKQQEKLLNDLLKRKKQLLSKITRKQKYYQYMFKEFKQTSKQLQALFHKFENQRGRDEPRFPKRRSLRLPVEKGQIVKHFGRMVHKKFATVVYQNGIEIEADQNAPVYAVMSGVVEFEGWVKGLGNVIIIHHGGGFYSLSAHLHVAMQAEGALVAEGDTIGLVGDTGNSETPGLYFEIRENGKAVDPLMYFSPKATSDLS